MLGSLNRMDRDKISEIIKNREVIKKQLPRFYDYHWQFCDEGGYFDFQIPHSTSRNLEIPSEIFFSGSSVLIQSYHDLIINISFSWAANETANEIEDESLANYFRFRIRNPHTKQSVHDFHRFLDHSTFHLNELSLGQLINRNARKVSFNKLKNIQNVRQDVEHKIVQGKDIILQNAFCSITHRGREILRKFRNIDVHRFPLGIDCIFYPFSRGNVEIRIDNKYGRLFTIGDQNGECYNFYGMPDFKFSELEPILRILGDNAKKIVQGFCQNGLIGNRQQ